MHNFGRQLNKRMCTIWCVQSDFHQLAQLAWRQFFLRIGQMEVGRRRMTATKSKIKWIKYGLKVVYGTVLLYCLFSPWCSLVEKQMKEKTVLREKRIPFRFSLAFRKLQNAINSSGLTLETNFIYIYKRTHFHPLNLVGRVWCSFFSGKTKLKYFSSMIGIYHNVAAADTNVIERKKSWNLPGKLWKGQ